MDLDNIYKYHAPKTKDIEKYTTIRNQAKELAQLFEKECPHSRELLVAFEFLESAVMWANASIARN